MTNFNEKQIALVVAQVLAAMGQTGNSEPFPATSAKVKTNIDPVSEMAVSEVAANRDPNHIEIVLTEAMIENRMKLPRRMFGSKDLVKIDGNEISQDEADQGRSLKFYPSIFGNVKVGQKLVFTFDKQTTKARYYDVKIVGKGHASIELPAKGQTAKGKTKNAPVPVSAPHKTKTKTNVPVVAEKAKREVDPLAKKIRSVKSFASLIEVTAEIAIDNESRKIKNPNIVGSDTFRKSLGQDSREFLPTPQSQAFRAMVKKFGKGMKQAVQALNAEFNLYQ